MRTTVTIDPDVEALIRTAMQERGLTFEVVLNSAVRQALSHERASQSPFRQRTFAMGAVQNFRWDKALEVAAAMEDEELSRKLRAGR